MLAQLNLSHWPNKSSPFPISREDRLPHLGTTHTPSLPISQIPLGHRISASLLLLSATLTLGGSPRRRRHLTGASPPSPLTSGRPFLSRKTSSVTSVHDVRRRSLPSSHLSVFTPPLTPPQRCPAGSTAVLQLPSLFDSACLGRSEELSSVGSSTSCLSPDQKSRRTSKRRSPSPYHSRCRSPRPAAASTVVLLLAASSLFVGIVSYCCQRTTSAIAGLSSPSSSQPPVAARGSWIADPPLG